MSDPNVYAQQLYGIAIFEEDGKTIVTSITKGKCVIVPTFVGLCKAHVESEYVAKSGGMSFMLDFCGVRQCYVCTCLFDNRKILEVDFS